MNENQIVEVEEVKEESEVITDSQCAAIVLIASILYMIVGVLSIVAYCCGLKILTVIIMIGVGGLSIAGGIVLLIVVLYWLFTNNLD